MPGDSADHSGLGLESLFDEAIQATQAPATFPITEELRTPHARYRDGGEIARGGSKRISLVEDADTGRLLAMATPQSVTPESCEAFLREARITANLTHPNVIPVYDVGLDPEGVPYFVMKLMDGGDLSHCLRAKGQDAGMPDLRRLSARVAVFAKICDGVAYAHARGVIHLDLKPANIQVGRFGEVLICDWGLAKIQDERCEDPLLERYSFDAHERRNVTLSGRIKGTPGYMAPEQCGAFGSRKDARTDVFALGCMLYELASLRKVVGTRDLKRAIADTRAGRMRPIPNVVPAGLAAVIGKALAYRPEDRYQTVDALAADLQAWRDGFATDAESAGLARQLSLFYRRNRKICLAGWAVAMGVIALTAGFVATLRLSERAAREALAQAEAEQALRVELGSTATPILLRRANEAFRQGALAEAKSLVDSILRLEPQLAEARNLQADLNFMAGRLAEARDGYRPPMSPLQEQISQALSMRGNSSEAGLATADVLRLIQYLRSRQPVGGLSFLCVWLDSPEDEVRQAAAIAAADWSRGEDLPRMLELAPALPHPYQDAAVRNVLRNADRLPYGLLEAQAGRLLQLELSPGAKDALRDQLQTNLALGAYVRTSARTTMSPETLIDGDLSPKKPWESSSASFEIVIDLGRRRTIGSVAVYGFGSLPAMRLAASLDGHSFDSLSDRKSMPAPRGGAPVVHWLEVPREARYLQFYVQNFDAVATPTRLAEIQVRHPAANLALGRPVTASDVVARRVANLAVDGRSPLHEYWEASGTPAILTVDFGQPRRIGETRAAFYYDGARYYRYEVHVSLDGRVFNRVVDRGDNASIALPAPYVDRFEPVSARFVQLRILHNSANPSTHVREFEIFPALQERE